MQITSLRASDGTPLRKTLTKTPEGLALSPYPMVKNFDSTSHEINNLSELLAQIQEISAQGACLLKGNIDSPLQNESRRGAHSPLEPSAWILLDLDGISGVPSSDYLMARISETIPAIMQTSYIYQPSSKAGTNGNEVSAHIFMLLKAPVSPAVLKTWLTYTNLSLDLLANQITLSADGHSLKYPLDITTCQNDKLIYVASPQFINMEDPIDPADRFRLIERASDTLEFKFDVSPAVVQSMKQEKVKELRATLGLPNRKAKITTVLGKQVIANPATAVVSEIKDQGEFIRLNINGGDSWAYWHPRGNWEIIYSFKDPDVGILAKEFVPEYYAHCNSILNGETSGSESGVLPGAVEVNDIQYFAFLDVPTDTYYRGTIDTNTGIMSLDRTATRQKVVEFFIQNELVPPEVFLEYRMEFRPTEDFRFDPVRRIINSYAPSPLIAAAKDLKLTTMPPTFNRLVSHVLAYDPEAIEHFIQWLAYIVQKKTTPRTAWVLHGTMGTGKGVLFNQVIAPIIGHQYTGMRTLNAFNNKFTRFEPTHLVELVDEVDVEELGKAFDSPGISASLKTLITEPTIPYEAKGQMPRTMANHTAYIFTSNQPVPLPIQANDRRFNVANRQEHPLPFEAEDFIVLEQELPQIAAYLLQIDLDEKKITKPLNNFAKKLLISQYQSSLHEVAYQFGNGNLNFFLLELPEIEPTRLDEKDALNRYIEVLDFIINNEERHKILRDQAFALFNFLDKRTPQANRFTSMLKKQGIEMKAINIHGSTKRGCYIDWVITDEDLDLWQDYVSRTRTSNVTPIIRTNNE